MQSTPSAKSGTLPAEIGELIGGYRLLEVVGEGGMGVVYRARHAVLDRFAAIKVLPAKMAEDKDTVSRFLHEAKVVNRVRHTNVVDIIDFVTSTNPRRVAYVMEFVEGRPLSEVLDQGRLPARQAINLTLQIADALEAIHSAGVVHRDLKPANVLVVSQPGAPISDLTQIKVLDFGIAKFPEFQSAHRTRTGMLMGTPAYMAPEQISGEAVSSTTDVYALAEMFFEMISGRRVFRGKNNEILKQKLLGSTPELLPPEGVNNPGRVQQLVRDCLSFEPEERPSLSEVRGGLTEILIDQAALLQRRDPPSEPPLISAPSARLEPRGTPLPAVDAHRTPLPPLPPLPIGEARGTPYPAIEEPSLLSDPGLSPPTYDVSSQLGVVHKGRSTVIIVSVVLFACAMTILVGVALWNYFDSVQVIPVSSRVVVQPDNQHPAAPDDSAKNPGN